MNVNPTQKKKLSGLAITSMIGAIIFSIAAALMFLLPVASSSDDNTLRMTVIGETGSQFMNLVAPFLSSAPESQKTFYNLYLMEVISASVAFFGLMAVALMVIIGKALNFKKGGRVLALIFSLLGVLMAGFYLVVTILYINEGNKLFGGSINIGIGPILMASFAFVTFIFCCLGVGDKSAFKTVAAPNRYDPNSYYAGQGNPADNVNPPYPANNNFAPVGTVPQPQPQPVQPQNMGYTDARNQFAPPPAPQPQPVTQPAPQPIPTAPVPVPAVNNQAVLQNGAVEGISGDYAGAVIKLEPGKKLMIGRDAASCNLVLSSLKKDISRKHVSVEYDTFSGSFKVIDMSSNGTFVNGQQLVKDQEMQFPAGTVLSLGSGENQFRLKKV